MLTGRPTARDEVSAVLTLRVYIDRIITQRRISAVSPPNFRLTSTSVLQMDDIRGVDESVISLYKTAAEQVCSTYVPPASKVVVERREVSPRRSFWGGVQGATCITDSVRLPRP